jgi:hypothetical protein
MPAKPKNPYQQEIVLGPFLHAQVTGDATTRIMQVPAGKRFRVDGVKYFNATGLAANASNFANIKLLKGATVAFNWSTQTGQQGTIAADTHVDMVGSATDADKVFAAGDVMSLFLDLSGTTTLPAGQIVVYGRYV